MLKFGFWNINKRPIAALIGAMVRELDLDVLVLAENSVPLAQLLLAINDSQHRPFTLALGQNRRVLIFTRLPIESVVPLADVGGLALRHVVPPVGPSVLLAAIHATSKLYRAAGDQVQASFDLVREIENVERSVGHSRTLVIGDFNMNPFEEALVGAATFHATSTRMVAVRGSRFVDKKERPFFYNPMWSILGDRRSGPPGTYYYDRGQPISFFWNTFDQALLRPQLLGWFADDDLQVITTIGKTRLLKDSGIPDTTVGSDHLPIVVSLDHTKRTRHE